jgi:hypothetical protein
MLSRMSWHMNVQLPLLVLCGAGLVAPWHTRLGRACVRVNQQGLSGWLLGSGCWAVWMVPRALDAAVADPLVDHLKFISLLFAGVVLRLSWRAANPVVQGFFVGNNVWMAVAVGLLIVQSPQRLCNAYLEGDQRLAGQALALWAALAGAAWVWAQCRHGTQSTQAPDDRLPTSSPPGF